VYFFLFIALHYVPLQYDLLFHRVNAHTIVISIFLSVNYIKKGEEKNHAIKVMLTLCAKELSNAICVYFIEIYTVIIPFKV
jgi:hypothetical protein